MNEEYKIWKKNTPFLYGAWPGLDWGLETMLGAFKTFMNTFWPVSQIW